MGLLTGKRALISGVASKRSIAWGIAQAMHREGAELAFTYLGERLKDRVTELAAECGSDIVLPCNVESDEAIEDTFAQIKEAWGSLDILVHAIAFAPGESLKGDYLDSVSREAFRQAHDISSYSLAAMAKAARPLMQGKEDASILTLSYLAANRTMPNYNVMGLAKASLEANTRYMAISLGREKIRVNAISAGPIKTLAASGIGSFKRLLDFTSQASAMGSNVTIEQVGNTACFLGSDWASGITGQVIYVDNGFSSVAMPGLE